MSAKPLKYTFNTLETTFFLKVQREIFQIANRSMEIIAQNRGVDLKKSKVGIEELDGRFYLLVEDLPPAEVQVPPPLAEPVTDDAPAPPTLSLV